jgi:hypothetical protein
MSTKQFSKSFDNFTINPHFKQDKDTGQTADKANTVCITVGQMRSWLLPAVVREIAERSEEVLAYLNEIEPVMSSPEERKFERGAKKLEAKLLKQQQDLAITQKAVDLMKANKGLPYDKAVDLAKAELGIAA